MLDLLVKNYGEFYDSIVLDFVYNSWTNKSSETGYILTLNIACQNKHTRKYEHIIITFKNIISLNFVLNSGTSVGTSGIYTNDTDGLITFDFEPIEYYDHLEERKDSGFKIKCKYIEYTLVGPYISNFV